MMKKILFLILITILIGFFWAPLIFAQEQEGQGYILLEPLPTSYGEIGGTDLAGYLEWLFTFAISIAGILAVLMIVIGGMQYITAYGNPSRIENAKNRITQALIGLLLAVSAWLILYTINPDLVKGVFTFPPLPPI
jgi:hypothetical protein